MERGQSSQSSDGVLALRPFISRQGQQIFPFFRSVLTGSGDYSAPSAKGTVNKIAKVGS
jgi:hypothetical protein